jgi:exodeoxyribonuclease V beta subunit
VSEARAHARAPARARAETTGRYPVPATVWAMEPRRHQVIEASAGTGKTYLLERRVLDLLLRGGAAIDQILLVTFTEKATAELRRRTRALVREVAAAAGGGEGAAWQPHWDIDAGARAGLEAALVAFDSAAIHTIHGFCHRVLQSTAFDGQRPLRQTQVASETALRDAFTACLRDTLAVRPDTRALLEAWLGAGRRLDDVPRALGEAMRLGGRLARTYDPERPALIDAALAEFSAAMAGMGGVGLAAALRAGRVHSNTAAAAERRARAMLDVAERRRGGCALPLLLDDIDEQAHELADKLAGAAAPDVARVGAAAAALGRAVVPLQAAVVGGFLPKVRERLERDKAERGQFDYGDMLELVWRALCGPRGDELAARLRARYPFALIDEFQDTDDVQWSIFRRIYLEAPAGADAWLSVVGDPKQAIYGFRGADVHTYLRARRELLAAGAQETRLDVCYRASPGVVGAVNRVLADAPFLDPFFSGGIEYAPVRPAPGDGGPVATDAGGSEVAPLCLLHVADAADLDAAGLRARLADTITDEIAAIIGHGARADGERRLAVRGRAIGAGDVFVLTRTIAESHEIAVRLRRAGVPCALYQQEGLLQTEEAAEVRDLLAAVAAPRDASARLRAWQSRFFAVPLADLPALAEAGESHPLVQRLFEWKGLAEQLDYEALFPRILEQTRLVEREIALAPSERALTNFLHLFELLLDEMLVARCDLAELVRRLGRWMDDTIGTDERNVQRLESERDAVQIMTIHRAKGLEAAVVFLFGGAGQAPWRAVQSFHTGDERWVHVGKVRDPAISAAIEAEDRGENERLLYVALTRACARLYAPAWPVGAQRRASGTIGDILNGRLAPLVGAADALVEVRETRGVAPLREAGDGAARRALADWQPRLGFADERGDAGLARALREQRGPITTSYTRLVQGELGHGSDAALPFDLGEPLSVTPEPEEPAPHGEERGADAQLSGRRVGIFLHEALELVPMTSAVEIDDLADWSARPDIDDVFRAAAERQDLDRVAVAWGKEVVWRGLRQPIDFAGLVIPGVARAARHQREVDFLFPLADRGGVERALVRGAIDLVFEHAGRIYWLDWKSDVCRDHAPDTLARHVAAHYTLQAQIYSLALARMLGISSAVEHEARFGGLIYFFLRGAAAHVERPSFAELSERALELGDSLR